MSVKENILISHPTGNANSRAVVNGLNKAGILYGFHTCIACLKGSLLYRLSGYRLLKEFRKREFDQNLLGKVITHPWRELGRQIAAKFGFVSLLEHEKGLFCIDSIYKSFDKKIASYLNKHKSHVAAVYAYEDGAYETFKTAKHINKLCIYDLPIGYWRSMHRLMQEEFDKNPDWSSTLGGFNDSKEKLERKDLELKLADKIYVASSFTKNTLADYPYQLADVEVIPYGFPPVNQSRQYQPLEGRKLKVLFVGGLSQRKGLSYLFDSVRNLKEKIALTVVGRGNTSGCPILCKELQDVNYIPALPHEEILTLMANADVLVFPSLFEGFGLVITEAMSQGTPVITTERTCGPDLITHGVDGWIVEAGNADSITLILTSLLENPESVAIVGKNAMKTAAKRPWACYENELTKSIKQFVDGR